MLHPPCPPFAVLRRLTFVELIRDFAPEPIHNSVFAMP